MVPGTPLRKSHYCGLNEVGSDEDSDDEPVATRTRSKAVQQTMTSEAGCVNVFYAHKNQTTGFIFYVFFLKFCIRRIVGLCKALWGHRAHD